MGATCSCIPTLPQSVAGKQRCRHIHTLTTMDCLLWADVEVVCPTESTDLIKTEETHHFIWLSRLFGLALIQ